MGIKKILHFSKILWCVIYNSFFAFVNQLCERAPSVGTKKSKILLISYPKSGSNWVRYSIEFLTKRPTPGHFRLILNKKNPLFERVHGYNTKLVMDDFDKIILLIRNYKECLISHRKQAFEKVKSIEDFFSLNCKQPPAWYMSNIECFDCFNGEKLLIYYEDLLIKPEIEIVKLINFLGIKVPRRYAKIS